MTVNISSAPDFFTGKTIRAAYNPDVYDMYRDNPLIEALPRVLEESEVTDLLECHPLRSAEDRTKGVKERLHSLNHALHFFEPLPQHFDLENEFSQMIRNGYMGRNPIVVGFDRDVRRQVLSLKPGEPTTPPSFVGSVSLASAIIGLSGIGKTVAVERILALYAQVIIHRAYHGRRMPLYQVVWLKLDCPPDDSVKAMCLNFFRALDKVLGTSYYQSHTRNGQASVDEMLQPMAALAAHHHLGVLVIDEIQHLKTGKSGGAAKMINFFTSLVNVMRIPVVLMGTYKAWDILAGEFRTARRGTGLRPPTWDRLEGDSWDIFVESLWDYQYTATECPLTEELSRALYGETLGITDLAIKVYIRAQINAITADKDEEKEVVTVASIEKAADDILRLVRPMLVALRAGGDDPGAMAKIDDIKPIDVIPYIDEALRRARADRLRSHKQAVAEPSSDGGAKPTPEPSVDRPGGGDVSAATTETSNEGREQNVMSRAAGRSRARKSKNDTQRPQGHPTGPDDAVLVQALTYATDGGMKGE